MKSNFDTSILIQYFCIRNFLTKLRTIYSQLLNTFCLLTATNCTDKVSSWTKEKVSDVRVCVFFFNVTNRTVNVF